MLTDSKTSTTPATPSGNEPTNRTMIVSLAEERLLRRLREFRQATLVTLFVGGDGEAKELFAQPAQREVLVR